MRMLILLIGIYCLRQTDFGSASAWQSIFFPLVDAAFLLYLLVDLVHFLWILQFGDSLRTRRDAEDDVWFILYNAAAPFVDRGRHFEYIWYWLGIGIEVALVLTAYVFAWGLMTDALIKTAI